MGGDCKLMSTRLCIALRTTKENVSKSRVSRRIRERCADIIAQRTFLNVTCSPYAPSDCIVNHKTSAETSPSIRPRPWRRARRRSEAGRSVWPVVSRTTPSITSYSTYRADSLEVGTRVDEVQPDFI